MADLNAVLDDLRAEGDDLDELVANLSEDAWKLPTPASGWTVAHQIGHLLWTDRAALTAIREPDAFVAMVEAAFGNPLGFVDAGADEQAARPPADLLADWRDTRRELADALAEVPRGSKILWFGPPMSPASMATARLMETWAHGGDIADALGVARTPTARLKNIAHLGVRTRDFAYIIRDRTPPAEPFRVALTAPDGESWEWGPSDATQSVTGPALDFCLLVTQRIHRDDTSLVADGTDADEWLGLAQAFAGAPGTGRAPLSSGS
ncbi:TIGR03084 family metal-binding protein [Rhodococcus sp. NPDC047139]|uniref:TIGR03084 family metal-binding protein n=1 Tax=Rhodococcus sp. NPDC047139 TaxID=3155141 RepID=UPI0033E3E087